jgi:hypothetical protein
MEAGVKMFAKFWEFLSGALSGALSLGFLALIFYVAFSFGAEIVKDIGAEIVKDTVKNPNTHRKDTPIFIQGDMQVGEKRACTFVSRKSAPADKYLSCGYDTTFDWLNSVTPIAHTFYVVYHGDPAKNVLWQCQRNEDSFVCWKAGAK